MAKWVDYFNKLRSYAAWNRPIKDEPPTPVVIAGYLGSDDSFNAPSGTTGTWPGGSNDASISSNTNLTYVYTSKQNLLTSDAEGTVVTSASGNCPGQIFLWK